MQPEHSFRDRLGRGDVLWGPFVGSPDLATIEALSRVACDVVCLDAEHGTFDDPSLSAALLACRAISRPAVVRVERNVPALIARALDYGADAVLCPHISDGDAAERLADAARYRPINGHQGRGFSGAVRSSGYGSRSMDAILDAEDKGVAVIAQIEDADAVENVGEICEVQGLDGIFIGRSDLTVSMGHSDRNHPDVVAAVEHVAARGRDAGIAVGTFTTDLSELAHWRALGISFFLLGSPLSWMVAGGQRFAETVHAQCKIGR